MNVDVNEFHDSLVRGQNLAKWHELLANLGFSQPAASIARLRQLLGGPPAVEANLARRFLGELCQQIRPETIFNFFEALTPEMFRQLLTTKNLPWLFQLLSTGPYANQILRRFPEWWDYLENPVTLAANLRPADFAESYRKFSQNLAGCTADHLRQFRAREILRLGLKEILNAAPVESVAREISFLADTLVDVAVTVSEARASEKLHGAPELKSKGYFHLGLGKLGGLELNLSSDIDTIPIYRTDQGELISSRGSVPEVNLHEYYTRVTEYWVRELSEVSPAGFVYRVDLRLRPEGTRGPLANSMKSALQYYEMWGSIWERAAYLKARPIAGDKDLAIEFLHQLEPFIYRRHLDFRIIEEMQRMKRLITKEQLSRAQSSINLKLDPGGIREIEFLVQTYQLIHGGREMSLRTGNTLTALQNLEQLGILNSADAQDLADTYRLLRRIENFVQLADNQQTHRLPEDEASLKQIAKFLNYSSSQSLLETIHRQRARVHELFNEFLPASNEPKNPSHSGSIQAQEVLCLMHEAFAVRPALLEDPQTRQLFETAVEKLSAPLRTLPDWRRFLKPLESFLKRLGVNLEIYRALVEQSELIDRLYQIFSESDFLTEILLGNPTFVIELFPKSPLPSKPARQRELTRRWAGSGDDRESAMNELRLYHHQSILRIGIADLFEETSILEIQAQITELAETCIGRASTWVLDELSQKYGMPSEPVAIVALGSLGAQELSYTSDLDLIFLHRAPQGETPGPKKISIHEFFTYFAQRLISFLSTATRTGVAYSIDTRLRPSGRAGTLVTSREAFLRYHSGESQLWEIQSLLRARPIDGPPDFQAEIQADLEKIVFTARPSQTLSVTIREMRQRIEIERSQSRPNQTSGGQTLAIDLKADAGGLIDIEFATQYLQLVSHGPFEPHTRRALEKLITAGVLNPASGQILMNAYDHYRFLGSRLCLVSNRSIDFLFAGMPRLDEIARSLTQDNSKSLIESLKALGQQVRAVYQSVFAILDNQK